MGDKRREKELRVHDWRRVAFRAKHCCLFGSIPHECYDRLTTHSSQALEDSVHIRREPLKTRRAIYIGFALERFQTLAALHSQCGRCSSVATSSSLHLRLPCHLPTQLPLPSLPRKLKSSLFRAIQRSLTRAPSSLESRRGRRPEVAPTVRKSPYSAYQPC